MYEEEFPLRLAQLRTLKGISARDMSLSIGQNAGYINNIETGKALPSMGNFFYGNTAQKKVPNTAECDIIKSWINK